ncbi:UNVERIFIED_CONTAM: hypothetical protein Sindi_2265300 [Sesamum indicum]
MRTSQSGKSCASSLFDEDENLDIPVLDEEEEDDDDVLLPEIPSMAAPPQHDEPATVIFIQFALIRRRARTTKMART